MTTANHDKLAARCDALAAAVEALEAKVSELTARPARAAGGRAVYGGEFRVKLLSAANPHRPAAIDYAKWSRLVNDMTVDAAVKAGVDRAYLRYMAGRGLLKLVPAGEVAPADAS